MRKKLSFEKNSKQQMLKYCHEDIGAGGKHFKINGIGTTLLELMGYMNARKFAHHYLGVNSALLR